VGIVVAGLGLQLGVIEGSIYSVVVGMAVITTLLVPPLIPCLADRAESRSPEAGTPREAIAGSGAPRPD
jgi:Kef-type K+ transport system membrane component KefB